MANLSDEERAAAILGDVEPEKAAETTNQETTDLEPEEESLNNEQTEETTEEPEKQEPEEATQTFTKQFPNFKGETLAEYTPELEKAYDNSFKEALRLNKALEEANATIASLKTSVQTPPANAAPANTIPTEQPATPNTPSNPANPAIANFQAAVNELPEIQRIKAQDNQLMFAAFDDFAKSYPQAREEQGFADFQKVSNGVNQALTDRLGRLPTYPELFKGIAGTLSWQATTSSAKKDEAIKNSGASSHTNSTIIPSSKRSKVTDAQVDTYLKMFTSKTREEAVKELSEVV